MSNKPVYPFYVLNETAKHPRYRISGFATVQNSKGVWASLLSVPCDDWESLPKVVESNNSIYNVSYVDEYPPELFVNSRNNKDTENIRYYTGATDVNISHYTFTAKLSGRTLSGVFVKETDDWWEVQGEYDTNRFLKA